MILWNRSKLEQQRTMKKEWVVYGILSDWQKAYQIMKSKDKYHTFVTSTLIICSQSSILHNCILKLTSLWLFNLPELTSVSNDIGFKP